MKLSMNPLMSCLLYGAAAAVLFAVAPGCGAPLEGGFETPDQAAVEEPAAVHAHSLPTECSDDDYGRMLCHASCGDQLAECTSACEQNPDSDLSRCYRWCNLAWYSCVDYCDRQYC